MWWRRAGEGAWAPPGSSAGGRHLGRRRPAALTVIYPIVLCGIFNPRNVAPLAERKRKPKFSKEELDILVTEVTHHEAVLFGRETMRLSHADRDKIWEGIARKITSVSQVPRSVKDIKHRWDDMKRRTKDKLAFMQQSLSGPGAGGRAPTIVLTAHERAIESALLTARSGHGFPRAELDGTDSPSTSCEYRPPAPLPAPPLPASRSLLEMPPPTCLLSLSLLFLSASPSPSILPSFLLPLPSSPRLFPFIHSRICPERDAGSWEDRVDSKTSPSAALGKFLRLVRIRTLSLNS